MSTTTTITNIIPMDVVILNYHFNEYLDTLTSATLSDGTEYLSCMECSKPNCNGNRHNPNSLLIYPTCINCGIELLDLIELIGDSELRSKKSCEICHLQYWNAEHLYTHFTNHFLPQSTTDETAAAEERTCDNNRNIITTVNKIENTFFCINCDEKSRRKFAYNKSNLTTELKINNENYDEDVVVVDLMECEIDEEQQQTNTDKDEEEEEEEEGNFDNFSNLKIEIKFNDTGDEEFEDNYGEYDDGDDGDFDEDDENIENDTDADTIITNVVRAAKPRTILHHLLPLSLSESVQFCCSVCSKTFDTKKLLNSHRRNEHSKRRKKYGFNVDGDCSDDGGGGGGGGVGGDDGIDGTISSSDDTNSQHKQNKQQNILKPYKCRLCDLKFAIKKFRLKHESEKHLNQITNSYHCPVCNVPRKSCSLLEYHMDNHLTEKRHVCKVCGKKFLRSNNLKSHYEIHNAVKIHECHVCQKRFSTMTLRNRHLRLAHTDIKPYECDICNRRFKDYSDIRRHKWSHGGYERQFKCTMCEKAFFENKLLKKHMQTHVNKMNRMMPSGGGDSEHVIINNSSDNNIIQTYYQNYIDGIDNNEDDDCVEVADGDGEAEEGFCNDAGLINQLSTEIL